MTGTLPTNSEILPLADYGWLFRFPNEELAQGFARGVRETGFHWLLDLVPAYKAVAIFHNPNQIRMAEVRKILSSMPTAKKKTKSPSRELSIPCCYQLGPDLELVAEKKGLSQTEVIRWHSETEFTVHAIGFSPGFPYMGYLPKPLQGVPRLTTPRIKVEPGSVGMTGVQTGIYPEEKPGGWNLIGRTPVKIVDLTTGFFAFQVGDKVRFSPITKREFTRMESKNP